MHRVASSFMALSAAIIPAGFAEAGLSVSINGGEGYDPGSEAFGAKYAMSDSSWDMSLGSSAATGPGDVYDTANLGVVFPQGASSSLVNERLDFELSNDPSTHTLSYSMPSRPTGSVVTLQYQYSPGANFDGLVLEVQATEAGESAGFYTPEFTLAGSTKTGAFDAISVAFGSAQTKDAQTLFADGNLADYSWTLTGRTQQYDSVESDGTSARFTIRGVSSVAAVPEPNTLVLASLGVGVIGAVSLVRRCRRQ